MDLSTDQKMEFLEKIANVECDVKDLKNKIKLEISGLNERDERAKNIFIF